MEIETVYRNLPSFTKFYLGSFIINTCLISLNLVEESAFELDFQKVIFGFQFWRLFTCFSFFREFSIVFVIIIILTYVCIGTVEQYFKRIMPDFYFMIFFVGVCHLILGYILDTYTDMMVEFM